MFSSPCNPSGACLSLKELEPGGRGAPQAPPAVRDRDEIYEHIVFDGKHESFGALPGMAERTITVNGFPRPSPSPAGAWATSVPLCGSPRPPTRCRASSPAAPTASPNAWPRPAWKPTPPLLPCADFLRRRDLVLAAVRRHPRMAMQRATGRLLPAARCERCIRNGGTIKGVDLSLHLLTDAGGVSLVEGTFLRRPGTLRISYATSDLKAPPRPWIAWPKPCMPFELDRCHGRRPTLPGPFRDDHRTGGG
jgi:aspartate aminotransferase